MKAALTDEHLARVADLRGHFGHRYAPEVAELYGVPVRTVHRWVYLATQRGLIKDEPKVCRACKRPLETP